MIYPIQTDGVDGMAHVSGPDTLDSSSRQESRQVANISVCVCTFKRPQLLQRLLAELASQETNGLLTYSVVVVDNDLSRSAENVASGFAQSSSTPVRYVAEPRQNIALARNKAVENADGDFVAFIDDDEFPSKTWLLNLLQTCNQYKVDGVLGPVKRHFDEQPPQWLLKTKFYERPTYPTGFVIDWRKGRTGNVLLRKEVLAAAGSEPFNPEFRTGEDQEFFSRMIAKGYVFIWCDEAVAYEVVPPLRWKKSFMLRRALLRGAMEPKTPNFGIRDVVRSLVAVCVYLAALPFAFVLGQHRFMTVLVSTCDHLGKLLAVIGINPIKEQYVTK